MAERSSVHTRALAASALALVSITPMASAMSTTPFASTMSTTPIASASTALAHATATIAQGIAVVETASMSFAAVAPPPSGGAIVLTTKGTISSTAGFIFRGTPIPGAFDARGTPNHPTSISFSNASPVTGPGPAMRLGSFTNNAAAAFDGTARLNFAVGATLVVNPNQTPGQYSGTYAVTVNF